jgi:hypothetical protein
MNRNGLWGRLVLAVTLAVGFAVVWGLVGLWAVEVGNYVAGRGSAYENVVFLTDGTPLVARHAGRHGERLYRDLEGKSVPAPDTDANGWLNLSPLAAELPLRTKGDVSWDRRLRSFADGRVPAVFWYFVSDGRPDGTAYFVGYDSKSKACVGYLGTAGLRTEALPAEERIPFGGLASRRRSRVFCTQREHSPTAHPEGNVGRAPHGSVSSWDVYVLGRDGKIYHADLQGRTLEVALDEPGVRSAALFAGVPDRVRGTPHRLAARTAEAVLVLDEHGRVLRRYPIPEELHGREFSFGETSRGEAVLHWKAPPADVLATEIEHRVYRVAPDGRCRQAGTWLLRPWAGGSQSWTAVVLPAPLVLSGYAAFIRTDLALEEGEATSYADALSWALQELWRALLIAGVLAAGLAVLCWRRQVRYAASGPERWAWPLFVLVLGLPGWFGSRFGRAWPMLEGCPACGGRVPRDREVCAHCAVEFPRPALKGTEVFA